MKAKINSYKRVPGNGYVSYATILDGEHKYELLKVDYVDSDGIYEGTIEGQPYGRYESHSGSHGPYMARVSETDEMRFVPVSKVN